MSPYFCDVIDNKDELLLEFDADGSICTASFCWKRRQDIDVPAKLSEREVKELTFYIRTDGYYCEDKEEEGEDAEADGAKENIQETGQETVEEIDEEVDPGAEQDADQQNEQRLQDAEQEKIE
jgi:hypothetical protein